MQISIVTVIDIIMLASLLFAVIRGWHIGFAMRLAHLLVVIASCVLAQIGAASLKESVGNTWIYPFLQEKSGQAVSSLPFAQNGLEFAAQSIAYYLIYAILFTLTMIVLGRLIHVLHIIDHIPVIGKLNKLGGAVIGFLITFILFFLIGTMFFSLIPQTILDGWGFTKEAVAKTYLLGVFANF